ncbi:MAG: glycosyltransferase [Fuerstiella sp.]
MKVLHSCQSATRTFGGVFEVVKNLVQHQMRDPALESIRVIGATDQFSDADRDQWPDNVRQEFKTYGPKSFGWSPSIRGIRRQAKPDLVHVHGHWLHHSLINFIESRRRKIPYIISPHGMLDQWALDQGKWKKRLVWQLFERRHLENAAYIHALCDEEAQQIRSLGIKTAIVTVPNGVNLPRDISDENPPWTTKGNQRILLFLGRLHPKKGIENLVQAWQRLKGHSNWRLVIAGWGDPADTKRIQSIIADAKLADRVVLTGPLFGAAKASALRNADCFILPSFSEGLPMSILEAWSYHLPVLMTDECHLQIGFQAEAAIRIDTAPDSLACRLEEVFSLSAEERQAMGQRGRKLVEAEFTWRSVAASFSTVYREMIKSAADEDHKNSPHPQL